MKYRTVVDTLLKLFNRKVIPANLTPQEIAVFGLIMDGLTYKEIGERLNITQKTVSKHASNILKKTNCNSRTILEKKFKRKYLFYNKLKRRRRT